MMIAIVSVKLFKLLNVDELLEKIFKRANRLRIALELKLHIV